MKQSLIVFTLALSIYDLAHDPKRVVVEACDGANCVRVVVDKSELEKEAALDKIAAQIGGVSR